MATIGETQLAILDEIIARSSGADAEALANLATAFQSAAGEIPNMSPEPSLNAAAAILGAIKILAETRNPTPEQISELAYAFQVLQEPLAVTELLAAANTATVKITTLTREGVAAVTQAATDVTDDAEAARLASIAAGESATRAKTSETNAATSAGQSAGSATAASNSAGAASTSKDAAALSAGAASTSAANALASERAAKTSETNASTSASNAAGSRSAAAASAASAKSSEDAARTSEANAAGSANDAGSIASTVGSIRDATIAARDAASTSASNAKSSETAALGARGDAANSATAARTSEQAASGSANAADSSARAAAGSSAAASSSAGAASGSEQRAKTSETNASTSASNAAGNAGTALSGAARAEKAAKDAESIASGEGLITNFADTSVGALEIPVFDGTTGKKIKTSGITFAQFLDKPLDGSKIVTGTIDLARLPPSLVVSSDPRLSDARAPTAHTHAIGDVSGLPAAIGAKLDASSYTANDVLNKLRGVDGAGSGLDADLLDGLNSDYFLNFVNLTNRPSAYPPTAHTHKKVEIVDDAGNGVPFFSADDIRQFAQAAINSTMVGTITALPSTVVPSDRRLLKLNGAELSRTAFSALWDYARFSGNLAASQSGKSQSQFGPGDGATTFTLPDYRGFFLRGLSDGSTLDQNRSIANVQQSANLSHRHSAGSSYDGTHSHTGNTSSDGYHGHPSTTDYRGDHTHGFSRAPLSTPGGEMGGIAGGGGFSGGITSSNSLSTAGGHAHDVNVTPGGTHSHSIGTNNAGGHSHNIEVYYDGAGEARPTNVAVTYAIYY